MAQGAPKNGAARAARAPTAGEEAQSLARHSIARRAGRVLSAHLMGA
jgi:hypothetical protein